MFSSDGDQERSARFSTHWSNETVPLDPKFGFDSIMEYGIMKGHIVSCLDALVRDKEYSKTDEIRAEFKKNARNSLYELLGKGGFGEVDSYLKSREALLEAGVLREFIEAVDNNLSRFNREMDKLFQDVQELKKNYQESAKNLNARLKKAGPSDRQIAQFGAVFFGAVLAVAASLAALIKGAVGIKVPLGVAFLGTTICLGYKKYIDGNLYAAAEKEKKALRDSIDQDVYNLATEIGKQLHLRVKEIGDAVKEFAEQELAKGKYESASQEVREELCLEACAETICLLQAPSSPSSYNIGSVMKREVGIDLDPDEFKEDLKVELRNKLKSDVVTMDESIKAFLRKIHNALAAKIQDRICRCAPLTIYTAKKAGLEKDQENASKGKFVELLERLEEASQDKTSSIVL